MFISGLPAIGLMTTIRLAIHSPLYGTFAALVSASLVGTLGVIARMQNSLWAPGGIDQALLSGNRERWWLASFAAIGFSLMAIVAGRLPRLRLASLLRGLSHR